MPTRKEVLDEMKNSLDMNDFLQVLSYYNIPVKKNSILCPLSDHNDTHYGSCKISHRLNGAYCYVCNQKISSISLVQMNENMKYAEALEFLWTNILGRTVPPYENQRKMDWFLLSHKELELIGINKPSGNNARCVCNVAEKDSLLSIPYQIDYASCDLDGMCNVYKMRSVESIYDMYKKDPKTVLELLIGKTREKLDELYLLLRTLKNPKTKLGSCCKNDSSFKHHIQNEIWNKISDSKRILRKLRKAAV